MKDYGRNRKKRKEYIHQRELLLGGVGVSKGKHDVWRLTLLKHVMFFLSCCFFLKNIFMSFKTILKKPVKKIKI